jgi:hypothetical protein
VVAAALNTINNPTLETIMIYGFGLLGCTNPVSTAVLTEIALLNHGTAMVFTMTLSNGANIWVPAPWIVYTVLYVVMTLILIGMTVRRVRRIEV